jgi:uncharacterized protein (TIGR02246 family)
MINMRISLILIILITTSCSHKNYKQSVIQKQIIDITNEYNKTWETLNVEKVAEFHSDESFLYWWHGGRASRSNDDFRKFFSELFPKMKSWTIKETSPFSVQVLNQDAAIVSFILDAESISQSGTISNDGSGALTYVWNKMNGKWKIVHIHESVKPTVAHKIEN